jgi:hypothetical protein
MVAPRKVDPRKKDFNSEVVETKIVPYMTAEQ